MVRMEYDEIMESLLLTRNSIANRRVSKRWNVELMFESLSSISRAMRLQHHVLFEPLFSFPLIRAKPRVKLFISSLSRRSSCVFVWNAKHASVLIAHVKNTTANVVTWRRKGKSKKYGSFLFLCERLGDAMTRWWILIFFVGECYWWMRTSIYWIERAALLSAHSMSYFPLVSAVCHCWTLSFCGWNILVINS